MRASAHAHGAQCVFRVVYSTGASVKKKKGVAGRPAHAHTGTPAAEHTIKPERRRLLNAVRVVPGSPPLLLKGAILVHHQHKKRNGVLVIVRSQNGGKSEV